MIKKTKEIWKDVPGFEGYYQASNLGKVRSLDRTITDKNGVKRFYKGRVVKGDVSNGYRRTGLSKRGKSMTLKFSQLIAMTFLGHKPDGYNMVVDHINGDRSDDRLENLRIVTHRENCSNCFRSDRSSLSSKYTGVSWNKKSSKWTAEITFDYDKICLGYFTDEIKAHEAYQSALYNIKIGLFKPIDYKSKFTSKYKGVGFYKNKNKWNAQIQVNYKNNHIGYFTTEIEAAQAYNDYVIKNNLNRKLNEIS